MKNKLITLLFPLLCYSSLSFATDKPLTLILDWFVNPNHAPLFVAEQEGFFKQQGLTIKFVAPADPADPPKLVAAGQADLAITYQPQWLLQVKQGLPLTRVATLIAMPLDCLAVKANGPIKEIKDLKGKRVGYSTGAIDSVMLNTMLKKNGISLNDVQLVNVRYNLTQALLTGNVDAVIGVMRNFELIEMQLVGQPARAFYPEQNGVPPYDELIIVANTKNNDPRLAKFLVALKQGVTYLLKHPESSWQKFAHNHPELNNELNHRAWQVTLPYFAPDPAYWDKSRYQNFSQFLAQQKLTLSPSPSP